MKRAILIFLLLYFFRPQTHSQNYQDTLTLKLQELADASNIAGFGVAIVGKDKAYYQNGFGYADRVTKKPYTINTIHNIGSTSKTLIALALMKLVEAKKLHLEDDINQYLPFAIKNPYHPSVPITLRQLATHTSSLTDGKEDMLIEKSYLFSQPVNFTKAELPDDYYEYFEIYAQNQALPMSDFIKHTYTTDGNWYDEKNFLKEAPGNVYQYTNIGATLLAYIIELVSGQSFADYTDEIILNPLGMESSGWSLEEVDSTHFASLYLSNGLKIPNYDLITYPDGSLITSIHDFSQYMIEMIRGINGKGELLLQKSYQEMMQNQLDTTYFPKGKFEQTKGLMWSVNAEGDNIYMNGSDPGVVSFTLFTTAGNMGIIIFTNTSLYGKEDLENDYKKIRGLLFQYAGKLKAASKKS